ALHLGHGESARHPGPGPARQPALRRAARLPGAGRGRDAVRLPANGGPPAKPEGGELRAPPGDEGPGDRGARAPVAGRPAELEGPGGGDRTLPSPAAAGADAGVTDREPLASPLPDRPCRGVMWDHRSKTVGRSDAAPPHGE